MSGTQWYNTLAPQNSFLLETQGYVQGLPYDDTVSRLWLAEGILASSATVPMWGGLPLTENINVTGSGSDGIGPTVALATSQASCTGFSTFYQMAHMVITPGASVPLAQNGNGVGFFRLNTQQRIAVNCDPALVASVTSSDSPIDGLALYWDVTNYRVTLTTTGGNFALPTGIRLLSVNTNSKIVSYNTSTKLASWVAGNAAMLLI